MVATGKSAQTSTVSLMTIALVSMGDFQRKQPNYITEGVFSAARTRQQARKARAGTQIKARWRRRHGPDMMP